MKVAVHIGKAMMCLIKLKTLQWLTWYSLSVMRIDDLLYPETNALQSRVKCQTV
jgi:hypothetical protein